MSSFGDQPFSENEERYFLAEILKKSNLSPITLINLIRVHNIEPLWDEIALPNGRSVAACRYAMDSLLNRSVQQSQPYPFGPSIGQSSVPQDAQRRSNKRPYSMGDATAPLPRDIQPRPTFPGYGQPATTSPVVMSPVEPPRKKRGRPTKAEYEKRSAEASARGEIWPKPRKAKPRRTSEPATDAAVGQGSVSMDDSGGEAASPPVVRPSGESMGAPTALMSPPTTNTIPPHQNTTMTTRSSIQDMIQPAGQAQDDDIREGPTRSDLPFYSQQPPLIPRISSQPRMPGSSHVPPYSPHQYSSSGYQPPTGHS